MQGDFQYEYCKGISKLAICPNQGFCIMRSSTPKVNDSNSRCPVSVLVEPELLCTFVYMYEVYTVNRPYLLRKSDFQNIHTYKLLQIHVQMSMI